MSRKLSKWSHRIWVTVFSTSTQSTMKNTFLNCTLSKVSHPFDKCLACCMAPSPLYHAPFTIHSHHIQGTWIPYAYRWQLLLPLCAAALRRRLMFVRCACIAGTGSESATSCCERVARAVVIVDGQLSPGIGNVQGTSLLSIYLCGQETLRISRLLG